MGEGIEQGQRTAGKIVCALSGKQEEHSLRLLQLCVLWPKFALLIIFNKIFFSGTSEGSNSQTWPTRKIHIYVRQKKVDGKKKYGKLIRFFLPVLAIWQPFVRLQTYIVNSCSQTILFTRRWAKSIFLPAKVYGTFITHTQRSSGQKNLSICFKAFLVRPDTIISIK